MNVETQVNYSLGVSHSLSPWWESYSRGSSLSPSRPGAWCLVVGPPQDCSFSPEHCHSPPQPVPKAKWFTGAISRSGHSSRLKPGATLTWEVSLHFLSEVHVWSVKTSQTSAHGVSSARKTPPTLLPPRPLAYLFLKTLHGYLISQNQGSFPWLSCWPLLWPLTHYFPLYTESSPVAGTCLIPLWSPGSKTRLITQALVNWGGGLKKRKQLAGDHTSEKWQSQVYELTWKYNKLLISRIKQHPFTLQSRCMSAAARQLCVCCMALLILEPQWKHPPLCGPYSLSTQKWWARGWHEPHAQSFCSGILYVKFAYITLAKTMAKPKVGGWGRYPALLQGIFKWNEMVYHTRTMWLLSGLSLLCTCLLA